jgi:hypothetical protein
VAEPLRDELTRCLPPSSPAAAEAVGDPRDAPA